MNLRFQSARGIPECAHHSRLLDKHCEFHILSFLYWKYCREGTFRKGGSGFLRTQTLTCIANNSHKYKLGPLNWGYSDSITWATKLGLLRFHNLVPLQDISGTYETAFWRVILLNHLAQYCLHCLAIQGFSAWPRDAFRDQSLSLLHTCTIELH